MVIIIALVAAAVIAVVGIAFMFANGARSNRGKPTSDVTSQPAPATGQPADRVGDLN